MFHKSEYDFEEKVLSGYLKIIPEAKLPRFAQDRGHKGNGDIEGTKGYLRDSKNFKKRSLGVGEVEAHFVHAYNVGWAAVHMLTSVYELDLEFQSGSPQGSGNQLHAN